MPKLRAMHAKKTIRDTASGLQDLIDKGEAMLESLKDHRGEAAEQLRESVSSTLSAARERLAESDISAVASDTYDDAVGFIRADPWRAVAVGALALLAGSLLFRAFSDD